MMYELGGLITTKSPAPQPRRRQYPVLLQVGNACTPCLTISRRWEHDLPRMSELSLVKFESHLSLSKLLGGIYAPSACARTARFAPTPNSPRALQLPMDKQTVDGAAIIKQLN
jgi:hypothetical protein